MVLSRETIANGYIEKMIAEADPNGLFRPLSVEERRASLLRVLDEAGPERDIWVFGYGSLMWNPAFHFAEARQARIYGYHRQFCLWTPIGRGTPEQPGLMLALAPGGSCRGIAYRVAAEAREEELEVIWRREMLSGSYHPCWVRLEFCGPDGHLTPIKGVTFVINRDHDRYAGRLALDDVARCVATAKGRLGGCRDYLDSTVAHLHDLGIRDRGLDALHARVRTMAPAS